MKRDDIIRMARGVGGTALDQTIVLTYGEAQRFAALVAAHEREECAKAAIDYHEIGWDPSCAAAIRARGGK